MSYGSGVLTMLQPTEKNRGVNQFQRFKKRPAPVHKLGHFGMCVTNFAKCYEFYTSYFNFHPSEVSYGRVQPSTCWPRGFVDRALRCSLSTTTKTSTSPSSSGWIVVTS